MKYKPFLYTLLFIAIFIGCYHYRFYLGLEKIFDNMSYNNNNIFENFANITEQLMPDNYPYSDTNVLLDSYPQIGKNKTSNDNYYQIWQNYPIFSLGSYEQITNNFRYHKNPDDATCIRADFCGAMYYDNKNTKSNIVIPLKEAEEGDGARVNYYRTDINDLYYSIPTNENILY